MDRINIQASTTDCDVSDLVQLRDVDAKLFMAERLTTKKRLPKEAETACLTYVIFYVPVPNKGSIVWTHLLKYTKERTALSLTYGMSLT